MKKDSITKSYDELTGAERASLAFHYMAVDNALEFERVTDSAYGDAELRNRIGDYLDMAAGWGLAYWQCRCRLTAALLCLRDLVDQIQITAMTKNIEKWLARIAALDAALQEVCAEHEIDADSMRRMVGADIFEPTSPDGWVPDREFMAELHDYMSRLITTAD